MELLKEETENFRKIITNKGIDISRVTLKYAFFSEDNYQGKKSHQKAAIKMIETLNIQRSTKRDYFLSEEFRKKNEKEYVDKMIEKFVKKRPPLEIKYTDDLYFYDPNSIETFKMPRNEPYAVNIELMNAKQIMSESFFAVDERQVCALDTRYYAVVFLTSPTSSKIGSKKDFIRTNDYLFPNKEKLVIYQWDNDWSNYFSTGKNWWGAAMWTVYDPERKRFTVISASASD